MHRQYFLVLNNLPDYFIMHHFSISIMSDECVRFLRNVNESYNTCNYVKVWSLTWPDEPQRHVVLYVRFYVLKSFISLGPYVLKTKNNNPLIIPFHIYSRNLKVYATYVTYFDVISRYLLNGIMGCCFFSCWWLS